MSLDGKIAWITGAGTGIGHAGATTLARHGVHVLLSGRRLDVLEAARGEITSGGGSAEVLPLDITDSDATEHAAKHGLLAMSAHLNLEEGRNGIRACTICPGEVNTPIIDKRPIPVPQEERERMLQPGDLGDTILFVCQLHRRACVSEIPISPNWNRLGMNQTAG